MANFADFTTFAKMLLNFHKNCCFFKPLFCENFEIAAEQKDAKLVEIEKCCQTHIYLQNFASIQPRTYIASLSTVEWVVSPTAFLLLVSANRIPPGSISVVSAGF